MDARTRGIAYIAAVIIGLVAAVMAGAAVLFGVFTPAQIETALLVVGAVTTAVASLARRHLTPDE